MTFRTQGHAPSTMEPCKASVSVYMSVAETVEKSRVLLKLRCAASGVLNRFFVLVDMSRGSCCRGAYKSVAETVGSRCLVLTVRVPRLQFIKVVDVVVIMQ